MGRGEACLQLFPLLSFPTKQLQVILASDLTISGMTDVHSAAVRSFNMSRIRSKDTKPEMMVRKFLHQNGYRYRLHAKELPGKPDIVLPRYKTIIFVQGCFWHGHEGCKYFVVPKTKTEWWLNKITRNKEKDNLAEYLLLEKGWKILNVWECELKKAFREERLDRLLNELKSCVEQQQGNHTLIIRKKNKPPYRSYN